MLVNTNSTKSNTMKDKRNVSDKNMGEYINEMNKRNEYYRRRQRAWEDDNAGKFDEEHDEPMMDLVKPILLIIVVALIAVVIKIILINI